jgi:hypothetical protein
MEPLRDTEMLAAGPFAELLARKEADLEEIKELAPGSAAHVDKAREAKALREAIAQARAAAPTCDSKRAAAIMGVKERQAVNLAKKGEEKGGVKARQPVPGGPWTFDVRSCTRYAERKRKAA